MNMVMSDGSVRFFKNSIAQTVWMAIGTRNQGESSVPTPIETQNQESVECVTS